VPKNLHRSFATLELWLIVLPTFFISILGWALLGVAPRGIESSYLRCLYIASFLLSPILCICCGALLGALASGGPAALIDARRGYWGGTFLGVALVLLGIGTSWVTHSWSVQHFDEPREGFSIFAIGAPMLLPAFHVTIARGLRR
jgi:hypothetical protein